MTRRSAMVNQRGDTLIEVLVALAILGIAVTVLMSGLATNASSTVINRSQTKADAALASGAEYVKALHRTSAQVAALCSGAGPTTISPTDVPHDSLYTLTYGPAQDFDSTTPCDQVALVPVHVTGDGFSLVVSVVRRW